MNQGTGMGGGEVSRNETKEEEKKPLSGIEVAQLRSGKARWCYNGATGSTTLRV